MTLPAGCFFSCSANAAIKFALTDGGAVSVSTFAASSRLALTARVSTNFRAQSAHHAAWETPASRAAESIG